MSTREQRKSEAGPFNHTTTVGLLSFLEHLPGPDVRVGVCPPRLAHNSDRDILHMVRVQSLYVQGVRVYCISSCAYCRVDNIFNNSYLDHGLRSQDATGVAIDVITVRKGKATLIRVKVLLHLRLNRIFEVVIVVFEA